MVRIQVKIGFSGDIEEIETEGEIAGLKTGDIFTSDSPDSRWRGKRILVKGFFLKPGIYENRIVGQEEGENYCLFAIPEEKGNWRLLERAKQ